MARMTTPELRTDVETPRGPVTTAWFLPDDARALLALAPGAGAPLDTPFMQGFAVGLIPHGIATVRFNFPYQESGRRSPDPEPALRATWLAVFERARQRAGERGLLALAGGKSLGGRIASMAVADGMPAAGLVFLGYPLHPPGRPERVRDEHLYRIGVPMLFLQGTADPFARPDLLEAVLRKLGDRAEHHPIEGGGHSFRVRGTRADDREVGAALAAMATPFVLRVGGAQA